MCTVSFIPLGNNEFYLTSNRDEWNLRPTLAPVTEIIAGQEVTFPKDETAGGTWIAAGENGRVCCLLNGAFERHERKLPYGLSRGKVILMAFEYENVADFFDKIDLSEVEPFTLVVVDKSKYGLQLFEFRWDATKKHLKQLDTSQPSLWSSATLYEPELRDQKEAFFNQWLKDNPVVTDKAILNFHSSKHGQDMSKNMLIERGFGLQTVSITQVKKSENEFSMEYHDLVNNKTTSINNKKYA